MFWLIQNVSKSASQYAIVDYTIYVFINNFLVAILTECSGNANFIFVKQNKQKNKVYELTNQI